MEKSSSGKIKETQRGILYFDRGYAVFNLHISSPMFKYVTVLFDLKSCSKTNLHVSKCQLHSHTNYVKDIYYRNKKSKPTISELIKNAGCYFQNIHIS